MSFAVSPRLFVITGLPGVGKGTQCSRISAHLDVAHISTGDVLRDQVARRTSLGSTVRGYLDAGRLVPDVDMSKVIDAYLVRLPADRAVLLDGFPRTIGQAQTLERTWPNAVGLVVNLVAPIATVLRRLCRRGRPDDCHPAVVEARLLAYDRDTRPALAWYSSRGLLMHVDANAAPHDVTDRIERLLLSYGLCAPGRGVGPIVSTP
jgi:adenylate kinase